MNEVKTSGLWSSDTVLNHATWYSAPPKRSVSHAQPAPPQVRGEPLEPNPFQPVAGLIAGERITYSSSRRDLRDRESVLAGQNRETNS